MLPNFIIVGVPRSGTTTLHYNLQQHPDIEMSLQKEPNFFAFNNQELDVSWQLDKKILRSVSRRSVTNFHNYKSLFRAAPAIGEASPIYFSCTGVANRIFNVNPDCKIIVILRQPTQRAYSDFIQRERSNGNLQTEKYPSLFVKSIEDQQNSLQSKKQISNVSHTPYVEASLYSKKLSKFIEVFGVERVHVILFEEIRDTPKAMYKNLFRFLGVSQDFKVNEKAYNQSGSPKVVEIEKFLRSKKIKKLVARTFPKKLYTVAAKLKHHLQSINLNTIPPLPQKEYVAINREFFHNDLGELEKILRRDMSHWK